MVREYKAPEGCIVTTKIIRKILETGKTDESESRIKNKINRITKTRNYLKKSNKNNMYTFIREKYENTVISLYFKDLKKQMKNERKIKNSGFSFYSPFFRPERLRREKKLSYNPLINVKIKVSKPLKKEEEIALFQELGWHEYVIKHNKKILKEVLDNGCHPTKIKYLEQVISKHEEEKIAVKEEIFSSFNLLIINKLKKFGMKHPEEIGNLYDLYIAIYYDFDKQIGNFKEGSSNAKFTTWYEYHIMHQIKKWPWKNNIIQMSPPCKRNAEETVNMKLNARNLFSIDFLVSGEKINEGETPAGEIMKAKPEYLKDNFVREINLKITNKKINDILEKKLTPREAKILKIRYSEPSLVKFGEIGKIDKITKQRIQQIEARALEKLRKNPEIRKLNGMVNDSYRK